MLTVGTCLTLEAVAATIAQAKLVMSTLGLRERLIVKLGTCGMRPGEIIALQWDDVQETTLLVRRRMYRGKIDTPQAAHSVRTAALPASVTKDIEEWRSISSNTSPDAWVFPSENGTTPVWANNVLHDKLRPTLTTIGLGWSRTRSSAAAPSPC